MRAALSCLLVSLGAMVACGSSSFGACESRLDYRVSAGANGKLGANISGYDDVMCEASFTSTSGFLNVMVYPAIAHPPTHGPRLPDSQTCTTFALESRTNAASSGPAPDAVWRSADCLEVEFTGAAIRNYLNATTYNVTVTCGGNVVLSAHGLNAETQVCAL
jgi:hypothetical protein